MALIPTLDGLQVPSTQILRQAGGDIEEALSIAAAYGYGCACRDLDRVVTTRPRKIFRRRP